MSLMIEGGMTRGIDPVSPERKPLAAIIERILHRPRARRAVLSAVFLLGASFSLGLLFNKWMQAQHEAEDAFRADAAEYYSTLRREIDEAVTSGASVADFFNTMGSVSRSAFRDFVVPHLKRAPGAVFLAWAPRVRTRDRDQFETIGRKEWGPEFGIFDTEGRERRAEGRAEYFPVYYRETLDSNDDGCFVGWDLGMVPASLEALERARDTGQPTMTAKLKLATDANGVLVYWPIYEKDAARRTVEERRAHLRGYIAIIFEINRMMEFVLAQTPAKDIHVSVSDESEPVDQRLLYAGSSTGHATGVPWVGGQADGEGAPSALQSTMTLDVGGRHWAVTFAPAAGYVSARFGTDMWLHFVLGLLVTALVGGYLLLLVKRTDQVEQLVGSCTQELRRAHDRLLGEVAVRTRAEAVARRLSQEAQSIQEEERRRLSRELHDEAGQSLTGLALHLRLLGADVPEAHASLRQRLREAEALANTTAERMRLLARGLRPPGLDTLGLNASLRGLCHETRRQTGVPVEYTGTEAISVPDAIAICLYRVLQEALTNAVKHAHATQIEVVLQEDAEAVALSVMDNGRGFNTGSLQSTPQAAGGIGLVGMSERLENLGGRLQINSRRGQGTCLIAQVPVMGEASLARPASVVGAPA